MFWRYPDAFGLSEARAGDGVQSWCRECRRNPDSSHLRFVRAGNPAYVRGEPISEAQLLEDWKKTRSEMEQASRIAGWGVSVIEKAFASWHKLKALLKIDEEQARRHR